MKVKELKKELDTINDEAEVVICKVEDGKISPMKLRSTHMMVKRYVLYVENDC